MSQPAGLLWAMGTSKTTDRSIAALAEGQRSLVTTVQLRQAGVTEGEIDYRVARRRLHPVHAGVYRMPGIRPTFEQRVMAACLATGGVASHRTAARLFGLRGFTSDVVEVTVDRAFAPRLPGVVGHKSPGLSRTTIGGIPVTVPARVLLDVAAVAPRLAEGAVADALARRVVSLSQLVRSLDQPSGHGRRGSARLRSLVAAHVKGVRPTESWLEDRLLEFLRRCGFPEPVRQHPLLLCGRPRPIRFDFAYPWCQAAIEADSRLWHTSPAQRRADLERDEAVGRCGWTVERVTWLELTEAPSEVTRRISRLLGGARDPSPAVEGARRPDNPAPVLPRRVRRVAAPDRSRSDQG